MLQSMETKGVNQIFWILLHSNGFPKACNRMQTSNILGLSSFFLFYNCYWNIKAIRMTSRCFHAHISKCFYAKQTISRQHHVRFRTVSFRLRTCCWEPDALPMQIPRTSATKCFSLPQKKHFRILIQANLIQEIVSLHGFWKTMLQVP